MTKHICDYCNDPDKDTRAYNGEWVCYDCRLQLLDQEFDS